MRLDDYWKTRLPQRVDARRNFEAVVAAAREALMEVGVEVTLEEVASRAGVGIATLYRNFPTRADLVEVVYLTEVQAVCDSAAHDAEMSPGTALRHWLDRFVEYLGTKRALLEMLNRDSEGFRVSREAIYEAGRPLLESAQAADEAHTGLDIDDVMRLLFALSSGAFRDEDQRDRLIYAALDSMVLTESTSCTAPQQTTS